MIYRDEVAELLIDCFGFDEVVEGESWMWVDEPHITVTIDGEGRAEVDENGDIITSYGDMESFAAAIAYLMD